MPESMWSGSAGGGIAMVGADGDSALEVTEACAPCPTPSLSLAQGKTAADSDGQRDPAWGRALHTHTKKNRPGQFPPLFKLLPNSPEEDSQVPRLTAIRRLMLATRRFSGSLLYWHDHSGTDSGKVIG